MWVISGGNSGCETGVFSQDTVELTYPSLYNGNADNTNVELYRVFTPGHWEDADGNWINGSWDSETRMTAIYDPNDIKCEWLHKGQEIYGTIIKESAWYMGVFTGLTNNNRNANIIYTSHPTEDGYFETFSWRRTWTNTKTEPNN